MMASEKFAGGRRVQKDLDPGAYVDTFIDMQYGVGKKKSVPTVWISDAQVK